MLLSITTGLELTACAAISGDFEYEILEDGTAEITKYKGKGGNVKIPAKINGYTVTEISGYSKRDAFGNPYFCTAFSRSQITSITIPYSIKNISNGNYSGPFVYCPKLTNIYVDKNNKDYSSQDGILFDKDKSTIICCPAGNSRTSYTIPNSVSHINTWAFSHCKNLKYIDIPQNVESMNYAAFTGCAGLTKVTINTEKETALRSGLFRDCINLKTVKIPKNIWIDSVVFYNCPNLTDVYYNGTKSDWNDIQIFDGNECIEEGAAIHCTDGIINDHIYDKGKITKKATLKASGTKTYNCKSCKKTKNETVYYPKTIKLSKTSYTYNGKTQTPSVTVKDSKGKTLKKNTDYTVTYAKGRKNVGKYAVKITFKGKYSGSKTLYYTIKPKATSISKLTAGKKKFTVKWKKQTSQTTGYQIQYSTNKNFKSTKTVTVSKNKTTSKTISKLKAKKKYYVRIRTYKTVGKTKYYSSWSKAKAVTTKR